MPSEHYQITVKGWLAPCWFEWFESLAVTNLDSGEAVLAGALPDQSALHSVLAKIRDLNLTLISVHQMKGKGEA